MPRPTRKALLVPILAAAALLGTGCSTTVDGTAAPIGGSPASSDTGGPAPGVPTDDPVAWMDQICGALAPLVEAPVAPDLDPSAPPGETITKLASQLSEIGDKMGGAIDGLKAAGPSPIEGGDAFVQQMTEALGTGKTAIDETASKLSAADPNDPESLLTAFEGLSSTEGLGALEDPGDALKSNAALDEAAAQAPNCQSIRASTGGN
ncbi:hypothetical protein [Pseudonocardia lacus]|uniref:hypothetical protein n=1 Tax=Pseudonocardia lacus TaxID=2835865 RepID=UPI001BDD3EF0|nr:hypothetical protein [Pseudonocardia lacus]